MSKYTAIYLLAALFIMPRCVAIQNGGISSSTPIKASDKYIDVAKGTAQKVSVFGSAVFSKKNLVQSAKIDLNTNRPLQSNEYYNNISTNITHKYILFIHITDVEVTADVMKSGDSADISNFSEYYKTVPINELAIPSKTVSPEIKRKNTEREKQKRKEALHNVIIGDTVFYSKNERDFNRYIIASIDNKNVMLVSVSENINNTLVPLDGSFYHQNFSGQNLSAGDEVNAELIDAYNSTTTKKGKILAYADGFYLVKTASGFHVLPLTKLKLSN